MDPFNQRQAKKSTRFGPRRRRARSCFPTAVGNSPKGSERRPGGAYRSFVAVQFCMMNVWPATTPSPVMFAPTSASRVSSRKALPPDRRRMNSLPCGVRRTTPRCSLLEPGETIADATFPVIVWSCACISPSHVFCDSDQAIVLRVGDEDTSAPQALWHMGRGLIVFHEHQHFLCRPALLHRGAIIALADNLKRGQILGAGAEASFLGDPEHRGAQATWGRGKSFPGVART